MSKEKIDLSNVALHFAADEIDCKRHGDYGTWTIRFVMVTPEGKVSHFDQYSRTGRALSSLKFHCQWEPAKPERGVYAQSIGLRDIRDIKHSSELAELVDILKKANNVQNSLPIIPTSFGQFVALMCQGLKIKRVVRRGERVLNSGWSSYDDFEYHHMSVDSNLQYAIDQAIQKTFPSAEAEVA
jgi:hypothetical protein